MKVRAPRPIRDRPRARTVAVKRLTRERIRLEWLDLHITREQADELHDDRPKTREQCRGGVRPCPWVSCRHHLYLDINPETGSIKINFPDLEPWEMPHSCSLDVADEGAKILEEVGDLINVTRERVRQVEVKALASMRAAALESGLDETDIGGFASAPGVVEPEAIGNEFGGLNEQLNEHLKRQGKFSPSGWRVDTKP